MNESIINHLFLPHYLPSSEDKDFLIQDNHRNEYELLECMKVYLNSLESGNATSTLPIFDILSDCVKRWAFLQNPKNISVPNLQTAIEQLTSRCFLPIYFHAQNAAILIEMDGNNIRQPLISSWQVSLPTDEITSSLAPHLSCFPVTTYRLNDRSQLSSKVHCELLMDFMTNTIEHSKSHKASRIVNEIRDVPESHYVCQWWIQQFQGTKIEDNPNTLVPFKKKYRDQIRWNNALLPFRRSSLWMTMKVIFQIILTKHFGDIGTVVYKLLITHFLTHILYTRKYSNDFQISTDLLVHCIRKIVRRLNKIETKWSSIDLSDVNEWYHQTKQEIQRKINQLLPESDWQKIIRIDEIKNQNILVNSSELNHIQTYQHPCSKLKKYLRDFNSSKTSELNPSARNYDSCAHINDLDYIPFIEELMGKFNYTVSVALTRIEIWVELNLERWINRSSLHANGKNRFEILLAFHANYQNTALSHYSQQGSNDSIGYSRFIITSLTILRLMHENLCNDSRFKRLKDHSITIPNLMMLFEFLVLPNREDMIRARDLYDYFCQFNTKLYPDLLTDIKSTDAFGVYFANQTSTMKESIQKIRAQAEIDRQQKIQEVNKAKAQYTQLMNSIRGHSCSCGVENNFWKTCNKCQVLASAKRIEVKIFECPIPPTDAGALAVIFELQMPIEIRCYRDFLWQFINRPNLNLNHNMYEWLSVPPHASKLGPFHTGPSNRKVRLVSSTKSATQTHYSYPPSIVSTPVEGFLFENSLQVQISPTKPSKFDDERRILTPQLDHPDYKQLQLTVDTTHFAQNQVIAKLSDCSQRLKPAQFVEFGSFRSGHRLQWWNLLTVLEMDSLSIAEESVAILIIHSILQYGPLDSEILSDHWCPDSHRQLLEDGFVDEFISRLNHHLDNCELNWQNELVLVVITMITMRILTICTSTRKDTVVDLAIKCRRTGEKWIELISKSIGTISPSDLTEMQNLRLKMVHVGVSCLLTFSTHRDRISCLLSSDEHVISLLKAATTVHDNIILNKGQSNLSTFMRNMMRLGERVLVMVQPTIAEYLHRTFYQSLNEFASIYWAVIKSEGDTIGQRKKRRVDVDGQWKKRKADMYDGWYDCQYQSRHISLDCIRGTFLVDDMTIGFLPEKITSNELFIRVFGSHIFEVQAAKLPNTYITKHLYHDTARVNYEFYFNDQNKCLIITEHHIQTNEIFQLISHSCFQGELADGFVSNHSHWWNAQQQTVEFRPVHFQEPNFLDNKPYVLSVTSGHITTTETSNIQTLVNQSSVFFESLFSRYFNRLDDKPYVYMMRDNTCHTHTIIHIHLSRLKIAFRYNAVDHTITSREYSDMCIDQNQWLGTLTGLKSGLALSPLPVNGQILEKYPYRKLIVPFGEIRSRRSSDTDHQIVTVERSSSIKVLQYFVFIMNDRLKILQPMDSPTGWLYLALLHAMTSHPLPDEYIGMTGMERAIQLLNSAGCWSDQPYDALLLDILRQIAAISPKVDYYPRHLACMIKIDWNGTGLPHSLQHFGYYLIANKLIENSQQLNFMYSSSTSCKVPEIFDGKLYNKTLLKKLYWDYRDSYNPMTRLSAEMEADILSTLNNRSYRSALEHYSHTTDYKMVRLVDGLYGNGDVYLRDCSQQYWLPLSQWLSSENHLKNIWIGLLKMTDSIKTSIVENIRENTERFEKMMDFLHYTSDKLEIEPFYLQMLKIALKLPIIISTFVTYPSFIEYSNIEQISVVRDRINISIWYDSSKQNQILEEVKNCFQRNSDYHDRYDLGTKKTAQINELLKSPM